ncbi:hypothetical protein J6590_017563 [Homalodisca vitripennis]|nr:hypothetical protein J6590_017563 [Homalodisca vitripennis]
MHSYIGNWNSNNCSPSHYTRTSLAFVHAHYTRPRTYIHIHVECNLLFRDNKENSLNSPSACQQYNQQSPTQQQVLQHVTETSALASEPSEGLYPRSRFEGEVTPEDKDDVGEGRKEGEAISDSVASDEITGAFRFLCDYRLPPTPSPEWAHSPSRSLSTGVAPSLSVSERDIEGDCGVSDNSSVSGVTGASIAASRGVGAPPHTPMGSTTKLIADSARVPSRPSLCPNCLTRLVRTYFSIHNSVSNFHAVVEPI